MHILYSHSHIHTIASQQTNSPQFPNALIGAFLGAFFAFGFFLLGEYVKRKWDRRVTVKNEHAFLERYLGDVYQIILYNKGLLPKIIEDYGKKEVNIMNLDFIPIREESSMKVDDIIFVNKIQRYTSELKRLNLSIKNLNEWRIKINDDLLSGSPEIIDRGNIILTNFLNQAISFDNVFEYHLDELKELIAENRVLLKNYNHWNYKGASIENKNKIRKEHIKKELELVEKEKNVNPLMSDHIEKLKKYGLFKDK